MRKTLVIMFGVLTLWIATACDGEMSYKKAAAMEPYASLEEEDRRWLYEHHMTDSGARTWLEDEVYFLDNDLRVWWTSDGKMELAYGSKRWSIDREDALKKVKSVGAPAAAKEFVKATRDKIGGTSRPPEKRTLTPGFTADTRKAQSLRYPEAFRRWVLNYTQDQLETATELHKSGRATASGPYIKEALDLRREYLGDDHEATQFAALLYTRYTGQDAGLQAAAPSDGVPSPQPHASNSAEAAVESAINAARQLWDEGDQEGALERLRSGYGTAAEQLGQDHPKTQEILQIGQRMNQMLTEGASQTAN